MLLCAILRRDSGAQLLQGHSKPTVPAVDVLSADPYNDNSAKVMHILSMGWWVAHQRWAHP